MPLNIDIMCRPISIEMAYIFYNFLISKASARYSVWVYERYICVETWEKSIKEPQPGSEKLTVDLLYLL